jgi:hypothetical protein
MSASVIPTEKVQVARGRALKDIKAVVSRFARMARAPEERAALADVEQEVAEIEERWRGRGLITEAA